MAQGELPSVEPPFGGDGANVSVSGVLLAAGTSSRFGGTNKLLADVDGEPLVRRAVGPLLEASLDRIFVVVGHRAETVRTAVEGAGVTVVENGEYERGQSTSVRCGLRAVRESGDEQVDAVLFALGDMPDVSPGAVDLLLDAFASGAGDPLAAACGGRRGNPVIFGRGYFERLAGLDGDAGGRDVLLGADTARLVETGDTGVLRDVDRPGDL